MMARRFLPRGTAFFSQIPVESLTVSDLGDLLHSMPGGGGFRPPFISVVAWDMSTKFCTKVVHYINNEFLKQCFN